MAPNVPESYLQARQEQIIKAAVTSFSRKGFHQTTMKDICEAAGLSPGAVYNYFPSKEDIVAKCAEMSLQRNQQMFATAADKNAADAFKEVTDMLFSMTKQEGIKETLSLDLEMWAEATRNQRVYDILRKTEESTINQMTEMVKRGQEEGIFNPALDAISIARLLFSVFVGFEMQLVSTPDMDIDSYQAVSNALIEGTLVKESKK